MWWTVNNTSSKGNYHHIVGTRKIISIWWVRCHLSGILWTEGNLWLFQWILVVRNMYLCSNIPFTLFTIVVSCAPFPFCHCVDTHGMIPSRSSIQPIAVKWILHCILLLEPLLHSTKYCRISKYKKKLLERWLSHPFNSFCYIIRRVWMEMTGERERDELNNRSRTWIRQMGVLYPYNSRRW